MATTKMPCKWWYPADVSQRGQQMPAPATWPLILCKFLPETGLRKREAVQGQLLSAIIWSLSKFFPRNWNDPIECKRKRLARLTHAPILAAELHFLQRRRSRKLTRGNGQPVQPANPYDR